MEGPVREGKGYLGVTKGLGYRRDEWEGKLDLASSSPFLVEPFSSLLPPPVFSLPWGTYHKSSSWATLKYCAYSTSTITKKCCRHDLSGIRRVCVLSKEGEEKGEKRLGKEEERARWTRVKGKKREEEGGRRGGRGKGVWGGASSRTRPRKVGEKRFWAWESRTRREEEARPYLSIALDGLVPREARRSSRFGDLGYFLDQGYQPVSGGKG